MITEWYYGKYLVLSEVSDSIFQTSVQSEFSEKDFIIYFHNSATGHFDRKQIGSRVAEVFYSSGIVDFVVG